MKKNLFLVTLITMLVLIIPVSAFAVTLNVLDSWEPEFRKHYETWVDQFEADHPDINVDNSYVSWGQYLEKLKTLTAAKRMPDIIYLHYSWAQNFIAKDQLTNLQPYIERDPDWNLEDFFDVALDGYKGPNGDLYVIPYDAGPLVLFYNMDMFEEAGVAPPPHEMENADSWTLEAFLDVAKKFTKDVNGDGRLDQWGVDPSAVLEESRLVWNLKTFGADLLNDDETKLMLDEPAAKEAITWFKELITKYHVAPTPANASNLDDPFVFGKVGMAIGGSWMLKQWTTLGQFDSDIAHVPHKAGRDPVYIVAGSGYAIPASSENKDAAWAYLKDLLSEKGMTYVWGKSGRGSPARESAWPTFLNAWTNKNADVFPDALKYGEYVEPLSPFAPELTDILNRLREELLLEDITVDQFVERAENQFQDLIEKQ